MISPLRPLGYWSWTSGALVPPTPVARGHGVIESGGSYLERLRYWLKYGGHERPLRAAERDLLAEARRRDAIERDDQDIMNLP